MPKLAGLKAARSLSDLANLLGFKPKALAYLLHGMPAQRYSVFDIPKRTGGTRRIAAPAPPLKLLQRRLSELLQDCRQEIIADRHRKDHLAHGFVRKRSIFTNARSHRDRRWTLNLDLEEFFPSINFGRIRGYFIRNRDFALDKGVATVIAQIACHENRLPQGSPCSPVISNLIAHSLDIHLVGIAKAGRCTYSRYADDITFSTNTREFPSTIALRSETNRHSWVPSSALTGVIARNGFRVNAGKTRMMYRDSRQEVTGLITNKTISVRSEYRHHVRAMVHRLTKDGKFTLPTHSSLELERGEPPPGKWSQLHGMLGFIDSIDLEAAKNRGDELEHDRPKRTEKGFSGREELYRRFLFYTNFYASPRPVILCEGKTDKVYLVHAIRSLAAEFPRLAELDTAGKIHLKVRLFKFPKTSTGKLLNLAQGGGDTLKDFIRVYHAQAASFGVGMAGPVIVVYDRDSGASGIQNLIKSMFKKEIGSVIHLARNLYAVPTPLIGGQQESSIEDCFDAATLGTRLKNKKFNRKDEFETDSYYGKVAFAHSVVRENASAIDFTGFRPLLKAISDALESYLAIRPS